MSDVSKQENASQTGFPAFLEKLIDQTRTTTPGSADYQIIKRTESYLDNLEKAFENLSALSDKKKIASSGVEWFLDNYFVIQEAVELINDDLPQDYFDKLPVIKKEGKIPRIYHVARQIIAYYRVEVVQNDLYEFLNAYQAEVPLRMSELWALPLMLRLVMIEVLSATAFDLVEDQKPIKQTDTVEFPDISADEIVARALRTLLFFDRVNWKEFFETHSPVDKILRRDPAGIYEKMDFDTRDQYRKKIEALAENSGKSETAVAQTAIDLAKKTASHETKGHHVGCYLVHDGEQQIKDLQDTIDAVDCDAVIIGTPIDLKKVVKINKPAVRVRYKLQEIGEPTLEDVLNDI